MKKTTLIKHHKWLGIVMCVPLLLFGISGILLNHRHMISHINVSRAILPPGYRYTNWNGGLLRGTALCDTIGRHIIIYGSSGMFLSDSTAATIADFNGGLPQGAEYRQIRTVVAAGSDSTQRRLFAVSPLALYRFGVHGRWHIQRLPLADGDERLTDAACHGDTLVVLSRSNAYIALPPYRTFRRIDIATPDGHKPTTTLFRMVWMLHSGEIFGTVGRIAVDTIALLLMATVVTGGAFFAIRKSRVRTAFKKVTLKRTLLWHDTIGRRVFAVAMLVCVTGWCLRPPLMIPLAVTSVSPLPLKSMGSDNPWHDKLRMIRYDSTVGDWLLSTSDGFFALGKCIEQPRATAMSKTPPVSVMGLNVWEAGTDGTWLCASFAGMYRWNRADGSCTDYFTHKPTPEKAGAPFGKRAISGYSCHFASRPVIADYYEGTTLIAQPQWMDCLPMSLWNVALEVHSGRMFIGSVATYVFVLVMGAGAIWCLYTGWGARLGRKKKRV